jgi:DinB superfamily
MPLPPRPPDKKLNPELERLVYQAKVIRQEAEGLVVGLTEEQLRWRPAPGQWSVAECFLHLNATNRKMADQLEAAIRRGRQMNQLSDGPFSYGFLSRMFHRMMEPPVKRRFKAPAAFDVKGQAHKPWAEIEAEWRSTHDRLDGLLQQANGLDLARIRTKSPASALISYPVGMGFWIQAAHDRRHLWQARQVINHANFPKVAAASQQQPQRQTA